MSGRLLRLYTRCPGCRQRPSFRIRDAERARYLEDPPELEVGTYQCQWCKRVYAITALAYQRAA